ncbi:MAG: hypothetical protein ACTHJL_13980 [Amnibacterium sp.]
MTATRTIDVTLLTPTPGASSAERVRIPAEEGALPPRFLEDPTPTRHGRWRLVETDATGPIYQLMAPNPHVNAP